MKRWTLLLAVLLLAPSSAAAQVPGIDLVLSPRAGLYTPLGDLQEGSGTTTKLKSGLALGASLELDLPILIGIRATLDAALDRDVETGGQSNLQADVVNIVGDIVLRPLPRLVVLQPYLLAGAGVKKYTFRDEFDNSTSTSDFTGHIGAGLDLKVGPLGIIGEVGDYISSYEAGAGNSKLQHDVFLMAGFRIGML